MSARTTRSHNKATPKSAADKPEIIQLGDSDNQQPVQSFQPEPKQASVHSLSSSSCSSDSSEESLDDDAFCHLAPLEDPKKQKQRLIGFKSFYLESQTALSTGQRKKESGQAAVPTKGEEDSIEPPSPQISDQELKEQLELSLPRKKPKLMKQLEDEINRPFEQFDMDLVEEQRLTRKREAKKKQYLIQKQSKQYREGKKKDKMSNQVFNGIEDFFM